jgi:pyridoxal phosphate enzyme (YggS family)
MDTIAARIDAVRERIAAAAQEAGRSAAEVRLVGVTKTQSPERIALALAAGLTDLGENRVQEAEAKIAALAPAHPSVRWRLIGHLQRNKAKKAAALFDAIDSLDSLELARALDRHVGELVRPQRVAEARLPVLLQVNVSGEASKEGFALVGWEQQPALFDAFCAEVAALLALPHLRIRGLMTIAPWGSDPEAARPTFRSTRRLRDQLVQRFPQGDWAELSMGMTDDFAVAIAEGATLVRVGRAIFGER